jgi:hypothetical protein
MRYATHRLLSELSAERKPTRGWLDPFGTDSPSCWCAALTSPSPQAGTTELHSLPTAGITCAHSRRSGSFTCETVGSHSLPISSRDSTSTKAGSNKKSWIQPRRPAQAHLADQLHSKEPILLLPLLPPRLPTPRCHTPLNLALPYHHHNQYHNNPHRPLQTQYEKPT